ncbi:MAG: hypothetical protein V3T31_11565, partial [candidate division Zixibacteria bacterium]
QALRLDTEELRSDDSVAVRELAKTVTARFADPTTIRGNCEMRMWANQIAATVKLADEAFRANVSDYLDLPPRGKSLLQSPDFEIAYQFLTEEPDKVVTGIQKLAPGFHSEATLEDLKRHVKPALVRIENVREIPLAAVAQAGKRKIAINAGLSKLGEEHVHRAYCCDGARLLLIPYTGVDAPDDLETTMKTINQILRDTLGFETHASESQISTEISALGNHDRAVFLIIGMRGATQMTLVEHLSRVYPSLVLLLLLDEDSMESTDWDWDTLVSLKVRLNREQIENWERWSREMNRVARSSRRGG